MVIDPKIEAFGLPAHGRTVGHLFLRHLQSTNKMWAMGELSQIKEGRSVVFLRPPDSVSRLIQAKTTSLEALVEELADLLLSQENEEYYLSQLQPGEIPSDSPYKLLSPLHVVMRPTKGEVWASALGVSGQGTSEAESKANLLSMLVDEMNFLRHNWSELGITRRRRLDRLSSIMEPR